MFLHSLWKSKYSYWTSGKLNYEDHERESTRRIQTKTHLIYIALVCLFDRFLVPFLIDQVDQNWMSIKGYQILKMSSHCVRLPTRKLHDVKRKGWKSHRFRKIHDLQVGFIPQRVYFSPEHGNTPTDLNETHLGGEIAR